MKDKTRIGDPGPPPAASGPVAIAADVRYDLRGRGVRPAAPGNIHFSPANTWRARHDVLGLFLDNYEQHGPIFRFRIMHGLQYVMLGPEANRFVLNTGREHFGWRYSRFGDLHTLIGDGLLTTDGDFHDASREIMMPAFHRQRVEEAAKIMLAEADAAIDQLVTNQPVDIYHWTQTLAMRIAMRALFGFDPDGGQAADLARYFEQGLAFHGREFPMQVLVGPGSPYAKLKRARQALETVVGAEIARRRSENAGDEVEAGVLGSLIAATDGSGQSLSNRQILDHSLTLLFAGHDTTTSTITFLIHELTQNPEWRELIIEESRAGDGQTASLFKQTPLLTQAIDETLRRYPPAWIGPRRVVKEFEFNGSRVPNGASIAYSSWASHHIPEIFPEPFRFDPARFSPERRREIPPGAYVPFGGGPRICIGKRFGYTEVHVIARALLRRMRPTTADPSRKLKINWVPTLTPKDGLPVALEPLN